MEEGSLLINAGCPFGIDVGCFQMKGGSLTIKCTSASNTFYAIDPYKESLPSFISGGSVWVEITSPKGGVGIHIPEHGTFSVTGGSIKINAALERIEKGTYGYSVISGEEIGLQRMLARPLATITIEEQEEHEQKRR